MRKLHPLRICSVPAEQIRTDVTEERHRILMILRTAIKALSNMTVPFRNRSKMLSDTQKQRKIRLPIFRPD